MKRMIFSFALLCVAVINLMAVEVSITMNGVSPTMTLAAKDSSDPVDVGERASNNKYTFDAEPGNYVLTGYATNGTTVNGTIELTITDDSGQEFTFFTITAGTSNAGWVLETDFSIEHSVASREGAQRITTLGASTTANKVTFIVCRGDSFITRLTPSEERKQEGYLPAMGSATITGNITSNITIPLGMEYEATIPSSATLFVGQKRAHFVPFEEIEPVSSTTQGETTTYSFMLGQNQVYNYRVSQTDKLTHAGMFTANASAVPLEITTAMLSSSSPKLIDHNPKSNSGYNVGDIFLNINETGHLKLQSGETHQMLTMRTWQITDNSTNNYFIEPDFHYTIVDESGQPSSNVIAINDKGLITTVGNGTAIVLVTYDAIHVTPHMGGPLFGAIWPENTGAFVVTVGNEAVTGIVSNITVNELLNLETRKIAGDAVDAEHDVFYYVEATGGFDYTFTPEGVESVTMSRPILGENSATYAGFSTNGVTQNVDNSYTIILTHGRNIVKLTEASGKSEYQIFTAKPTGYDILNTTNPGMPLQPGDRLSVRFNGLFHPANKLAGVYNMSTYVQFNGIPNGTSVILGPNQYTFGSSEQLISMNIPEDWDTDTSINFTEGVLQVSGFGDPIGAHRQISMVTGRFPNFTAISHQTYFGSLPDVTISVQPTAYFTFAFDGMSDDATITVSRAGGAVITPNEDGEYIQSYGTYLYDITCEGYRALHGSFTINTESPETQTIQVELTPIVTGGWNGTAMTEPETNPEGYYLISTGAELAWFADKVNTETVATENNALLVNDIDLGDYQWTPIGASAAARRYRGTFDGGNHTVKGLYIRATNTDNALFRYIDAATIQNLTVEGEVTSTANYTAGVVACSAGAISIINCHNKVNVTGTQYVAGILASATAAAITITDCTNMGDIMATSNYVAGLVGNFASTTVTADAIINNLSNGGTITSRGNFVGGLFGSSALAPLTNVINTGNVSGGATNVAGITGNINLSGAITGSVSNAFNAGTVTSTSAYVGAIVGQSATGVANGTLTNVYTLDMDCTDDVVVKTADEFASGEVAWLLGEAFGQELGVDELPVLNGDKVYQVSYTNNMNNEIGMSYINGSLAAIEETDGFLTTWYSEEDGEVLTGVSEDSNLHRFYTDIAAPSIPTDLEGVATETNISLSWTASIDNVEVTGYNVYLNDELEAFVIEANYLIRRLSLATEYTIEVEAIDAAGNKSDKVQIVVKTLGGTNIQSIENIVRVYPNPFVDYILLTVSANDTVVIYDLSGRVVLSQTVTAGSNRIDTSALPQGTYVLKSGANTVKIVK